MHTKGTEVTQRASPGRRTAAARHPRLARCEPFPTSP